MHVGVNCEQFGNPREANTDELRDKKRFSTDNEYGITLVSLKDKFKSAYEPFAAPLEERNKVSGNASQKRPQDQGKRRKNT